MYASCHFGTMSCTLGEEDMTDPVLTARSFYDHTHPDTDYFALSARCTVPELAVDDTRTDSDNILAQKEHGPPNSG